MFMRPAATARVGYYVALRVVPVEVVRVLLVEDDPPFCDLACTFLDGYEVRVARPNQATALDAHVAVVDLCLELITELATANPHLPILVLGDACSETRTVAAFRAGARGYLLKQDVARLRAAIAGVIAGESPMSAGVARVVMSHLRYPASTAQPTGAHCSPTDRELAVVEQLRKGLTYVEVGQALGVSTNTVRTHIRSLYEKLSVSTKTEAVLEAIRVGWLH